MNLEGMNTHDQICGAWIYSTDHLNFKVYKLKEGGTFMG